MIKKSPQLNTEYPHEAWLLTGSNEGDRSKFLQFAIEQLNANSGTIVARSSVYETAAWGKEGFPAHLNQALYLRTRLSPLELLDSIQAIELAAGRRRADKWGQRCLDIDIIFYDRAIIDEPHLQIPHPWMQHRRFVLTPLCEIASHYVHPVLQQSVADLLSTCQDTLEVTIYDVSK